MRNSAGPRVSKAPSTRRADRSARASSISARRRFEGAVLGWMPSSPWAWAMLHSPGQTLPRQKSGSAKRSRSIQRPKRPPRRSTGPGSPVTRRPAMRRPCPIRRSSSGSDIKSRAGRRKPPSGGNPRHTRSLLRLSPWSRSTRSDNRWDLRRRRSPWCRASSALARGRFCLRPLGSARR